MITKEPTLQTIKIRKDTYRLLRVLAEREQRKMVVVIDRLIKQELTKQEQQPTEQPHP
jgi:hypothetical protein